MDLIGKKHLDDLKKRHADTRNPINSWINEVEEADWNTFQDIKDRYSTVDHIGNGLHIFNIKGTKYRIAVKVFIGKSEKTVLVKKTGTHEEYMDWDLEELKK